MSLLNIRKSTYRIFKKNRAITLINLICLTIGISSFGILKIYVNFERSYDNFHTHKEYIYRVNSLFHKNGELQNRWATSSYGYAPAMKEEFPEIEEYVRLDQASAERVVSYHNDIKFTEQNVYMTDPSFFNLFSYKLITGNKDNVLKEPNTVVLSASTAKKYFGEEDPIGKILTVRDINDIYECKITGIFEDTPQNSNLQFNILLSWSTNKWKEKDQYWYMHEAYTYVKLKPNGNPHRIEKEFPAMAEKYKTGQALKDQTWGVELIPLTNIHLNPPLSYEKETKGDRTLVDFISYIAYAIILIALINYLSIMTISFIDRIKEISIKKVLGASVFDLFKQFFLESMFINAVALFLSVVIIFIFRSAVIGFFDKDIFSIIFSNPSVIITILLVVLSGVFIISLYPTYVLSFIKLTDSLKSKISNSNLGNINIRKILIITQCTLALILVSVTIIVNKQLSYMQDTNLGIQTERIMALRMPMKTEMYGSKIESFKNELANLSGINVVSISSSIPSKDIGRFLTIERSSSDDNKSDHKLCEMLRVDYDFHHVYQMKLESGTWFDKNSLSNTTEGIILNKAAMKLLHFNDSKEALNQKVKIEDVPNKEYRIIGVLSDYHHHSLRQEQMPTIYFMFPEHGWINDRFISINCVEDKYNQLTNNVNTIWSKFFPESPMDHFLVSDSYITLYANDRKLTIMFQFFSALSLFIAFLGFYGMSIFYVKKRIKEIALRKVFGASVKQILMIIFSGFSTLAIISAIIAIPTSYFIARSWLNSFPFRTQLELWVFAIPLLVILLLISLSVGFNISKVFRISPVKVFKEE